MDPTVVAAWIAAGVSALTLVGTLAAQYFGRRATSRDIEKTLAEQSRQLDRTLAEQRTRTWNERFGAAAEQLGSDKPAAVRLAGVYAMAGLADDWEANRQTCVDVLCAYLRMPYEPDPGEDSLAAEQLAFQASREVRHTVIRVIAAHLQDGSAAPWRGFNFDFTGVVFDGGSFAQIRFTGGEVSFDNAKFTSGRVGFDDADFAGAKVSFRETEFTGGEVNFYGSKFSGGKISFRGARFSGSEVSFRGAEFTGSEVNFYDGDFNGGIVSFRHAEFTGGIVSFRGAEFSGSEVSFRGAEFTGGEVNFYGTEFTGGEVDFDDAEFTGSEVSFYGAEFTGCTVDFSTARAWSYPPTFPWVGMPPSSVKLPSPASRQR
jgi:uncharacterized protein YjbI with pentapeptide repeats